MARDRELAAGARAERPRADAPRRAAARGAVPWTAGALVLLMSISASAEALHIGFFADDFHFLDVARRVPLVRALGGAWGIYPWYRPLSRELFFALIEGFGPRASLAAHVMNLAGVAGIAWLVFALARRTAGAAAAPLAAALFVTFQFTRFLAAWASGFQDLLSTGLVLLAILDHARARRGCAAIWIALAPLAKETGFLALPLVLLWSAVIEGERRPRRWMIAPALAAAAAFALHILVRLAWRSGGSAAVIHATAADLPGALLGVLGGFLGSAPVIAPVTGALAALAALATVTLMRGAWLEASRDSGPSPGARAFAALASAFGLLPLTLGVALRLTEANIYYAFPAVPFLCLLAAIAFGAAPRGVVRAGAIVMPLLVAWNVLALGFLPPGPLEDSAWTFRRWDWREAERLDVISARLAADLRLAIPARAESLVILFAGLPTGSFFQTEDGPASRVALTDPTLRAWYLNAAPRLVERGRFAVLMFDPLAKRMGPGGMPPAERIRAAATAVFRGQAGTAWAYASWADSSEYDHPDRAYARAAARLMARGPAGYRAALAEGGLADSLGARPAQLAAWEFPSDPELRGAYAEVLSSPLDAARHAALAARLLARGYAVAGGFELRVAVTLDPARVEDAAKLEALMAADARNAMPGASAAN